MSSGNQHFHQIKCSQLTRCLLAMDQVVSTTTCWTWDSRLGGKLRVVKLWLDMLGMTL